MADIKAIAEALVNISSEEVAELAKVLQDEYGITAKTEEKTSVVQKNFIKKISKHIREEKMKSIVG